MKILDFQKNVHNFFSEIFLNKYSNKIEIFFVIDRPNGREKSYRNGSKQTEWGTVGCSILHYRFGGYSPKGKINKD